jgi:hypothetical protein
MSVLLSVGFAVSAHAATVSLGATAPAQTVAFTEYQIKAAFLFNFANFVEWPDSAFESPQSPVVIGVLGDCPFGSTLEAAVEGETINKRPIAIKRSRQLEELRRCHILFISRSERARLPHVLAHVRDWPVLTVCELDRFAQQGGMIGFVIRDNKVRFEANLDAAERAGLKISAKLSKLAVAVYHDTNKERH